MRVLVIGGAGYIGSALVKQLLKAHHEVVLYDIFLYGHEAIKDMQDSPGLTIITGDIRDIEMLSAAMQNVQAVVNLAAIVGDPACSINHDLTYEINMYAARKVAELARSLGIRRFIFSSTCSVYGSRKNELTEDAPCKPLSFYAQTKLAAEYSILAMASDSFCPCVLRFGTIYGFSGRIRFDLVVNILVAKALREKEITIYGGDQWRPFVHVEDAARAIAFGLSKNLSLLSGEIFNVASDNYSIEDIGDIVATQIPGTAKKKENGVDARDYIVSTEKITQLGFRSFWTVEQGIRQVAKTIREQKIDYWDNRYNNQKFLLAGGIKKLEESYAYSLC